eukprot:1297794-Lingulodinium_polyedra.AAC.1
MLAVVWRRRAAARRCRCPARRHVRGGGVRARRPALERRQDVVPALRLRGRRRGAPLLAVP